MYANVQKWGNSLAIRFPKRMMDSLGIKENDEVLIIQTGDSFTISKRKKHISLKERIETFYGKPIDEIDMVREDEISTGEPRGEEIW